MFFILKIVIIKFCFFLLSLHVARLSSKRKEESSCEHDLETIFKAKNVRCLQWSWMQDVEGGPIELSSTLRLVLLGCSKELEECETSIAYRIGDRLVQEFAQLWFG